MILPFKANSKVIELGGGDNCVFRPNVDIRPGPTVDIVADLNKKLPIADKLYDGVYSAYNIEHMSWRKVKQFISEIFRILSQGGVAFIVTANLLEQCKSLIKEEWNEDDICRLFGDQNYAGDDWVANAHYCGFSPNYVVKLFREAGFSSVIIIPHPHCKTDMIIEARKPLAPLSAAKKFSIEYFDSVGNNYLDEDPRLTTNDIINGFNFCPHYYDVNLNWTIVNTVRSLSPSSVLELGAARGYVVKKLRDIKINAVGVDVSEHCFQTRTTDHLLLHDLTITPWPFMNHEFDLCFSSRFLEHVSEEKLPTIIDEMNRVSCRGFHIVRTASHGTDSTIVNIKSIAEWQELLKCRVVDYAKLPITESDVPGPDGLLKLNIGCALTMFHYGWTNIDKDYNMSGFAAYNKYIFKTASATDKLDYRDESVDMIFTSHMLEHLTKEGGADFLKEAYRVLKAGSIIRILVPDAKLLFSKCLNRTMFMFNEVNNNTKNADTDVRKLESLLLDNHKTTYDYDLLKVELERVGFSKVVKQQFNRSLSDIMRAQTIDSFPELSLIVEAIK